MVQEYNNNKYDYMKVRFVGLINQLTIFIKKSEVITNALRIGST